ncbi:myb domain protein 12 [Striga asiatica]|uniref:Myb domain protein 12 n=1 Tax=Striga asiatica TaxID=4170 RepID=A0A5A7PQ34_STRAF|nr:myb domain protein 12 [Striga asiatica]
MVIVPQPPAIPGCPSSGTSAVSDGAATTTVIHFSIKSAAPPGPLPVCPYRLPPLIPPASRHHLILQSPCHRHHLPPDHCRLRIQPPVRLPLRPSRLAAHSGHLRCPNPNFSFFLNRLVQIHAFQIPPPPSSYLTCPVQIPSSSAPPPDPATGLIVAGRTSHMNYKFPKHKLYHWVNWSM